jgi:hypothetical protein
VFGRYDVRWFARVLLSVVARLGGAEVQLYAGSWFYGASHIDQISGFFSKQANQIIPELEAYPCAQAEGKTWVRHLFNILNDSGIIPPRVIELLTD